MSSFRLAVVVVVVVSRGSYINRVRNISIFQGVNLFGDKGGREGLTLTKRRSCSCGLKWRLEVGDKRLFIFVFEGGGGDMEGLGDEDDGDD